MRSLLPNGDCCVKTTTKISYKSGPKEVIISGYIKVYKEAKYLTVKYITYSFKY